MRLTDLSRLRTAPVLNATEKALIVPELQQQMILYRWFTAESWR